LAGIYIHIPFCRQACHYCDFHFSTNLGRMDEMVSSIVKEIGLRKAYLKGETIETVYFGGGTPSLLSAKHLENILQEITQHFSSDWKELTLEANPDDLTEEKLSDWKKLGIDRLSLGIQSFNEEVLKFYNRAHTAEESHLALEKARKAGFEKFSIDLIYGFPFSDHSLWKSDLKKALAIDPGHISAYSLTVESKTALGNWAAKGKFIPADEDFVAEQFEYLQTEAEQLGYIQYEVSNFGKPGKFALHNTNYWKKIPYLGLGPSAHSFDGENRGANLSSNASYIGAMMSGKSAFRDEVLTKTDQLNEYLLTGLRTIWGVDMDFILEAFGTNLKEDKKTVLEQMKSRGWLIWKGNTLSLSKSGKLLADSIASALFL
jgi:oxygen-independent coproporphyrinogen III oxidase